MCVLCVAQQQLAVRLWTSHTDYAKWRQYPSLPLQDILRSADKQSCQIAKK